MTYPSPDASFDRVFSSFMFHHLPVDQRGKTLREVRRVLVPGGSFHLLDFARPEDRAVGWWPRMLYSSPHLKDNSDSRIITLMREAGLVPSKKIKDGRMLFGLMRISYYQAFTPEQGEA